MQHTVDEIEAAGGFPIIYADPPWSYDQGGRGAARNHYSTMTLDQIEALPVARLASPDAVLFIWGTWPNLPMIMRVIPAWGFAYKTCAFVWVKHHEPSGKTCVGGGFWTRANTEFCLLAVRGDPPRRVDRAVRQLVEMGPEEVLRAPRQAHSAKPAEARARIDRLMGPDLPKIELFARERADGWAAWGDDPALGGSDVLLLP